MNPVTDKQLGSYVDNPSHSITLVAPTGSGKHSVALMLASRILAIEQDRLTRHPYFKIILSQDGKAIGIEAIRELEHFLSLKVPSSLEVHRIIVIEEADLLTIEAQNAFLKTLEEPPAGTIFILTSSHDQSLLPTIRSRSPKVIITKPDYNDLRAYFTKIYSNEIKVDKALVVSGGLPGLTAALLSQDAEHPLFPATVLARKLLTESTYERLLHSDELVKDKPLFLNTLFILQQMAHLSLLSSKGAASVRWQAVLNASYSAQKQLLSNSQPKLVISDLMLHL